MNFPVDLAFWRRWDEDERRTAIRISGLAVGMLCIFFLIAIVSYLLHWQEDMSAGTALAGHAGKLGYRTGRLLVCECFGFGSFAIPLILGVVSLRLFAGKFKSTLLKTILLSLFGALIAAVTLSFISSLTGLETAFGGGLGGRCGAFISTWTAQQVGNEVTGLLIVLAIMIWLFCASRRFTRWMAGNGKADRAERKAKLRAEKELAKQEEEAEEEAEKPMEIKDIPGIEEIPVLEEASIPAEEPEEAVTTAENNPGMEIIRDDALSAEVLEELPPIDNRLDPPDGLPKYKFPPLDLLESYGSSRNDVSMEELNRNNNKIRSTLGNYKIDVVDVKAVVGPTITLYKVYPAPGVQISQIKRLQEDIAMSLNAKGVRVVTLTDSVGIEVANDKAAIVPVKALLNDENYRSTKAELPIALGYTITQKVKIFDLADAPHLLVAGATKQGKSVCLNEIITSLLYAKHPSELKFVFIDPKMVEFSAYGKLLKHYLAVLPENSEEDEVRNAIVKAPKNAERILRSLTIEMDERYKLLSEAGVNNLGLYNAKYKERKLRPDHGHRFMPYIVVVVDEYADLTMSAGASAETRASAKSITNSIIRLAQKGRAAGLHVILATQRPSVDVISGQIKANFPARIAFRVAQRVDSMTILDAPGADKLIGKGDMLFSAGIDAERLQCGLVGVKEIEAITSFIGDQKGPMKCYNTPYYLPSADENQGEGAEGGGPGEIGKIDERFEEAARMVVMLQKGSTSALQTKLGMGFAKAARVMDQLESAGIVGPSLSGGKPREVLIGDLDTLEEILRNYR